MQYRTLGSTGVHVSSLCLGAMMFGEWGNPDHDDSIGVIRTIAQGCASTAMTLHMHSTVMRFIAALGTPAQ